MILPKSLMDTSSISGKPSPGSFGASQDNHAQTQFNGILANLASPSDASVASSKDAGKNDSTPPGTAGQTFNAAAFGLLVSSSTSAKTAAVSTTGALADVPSQTSNPSILLAAASNATLDDASVKASKLPILLPAASNAAQTPSSSATPVSILADAKPSVLTFAAPSVAASSASALSDLAPSLTTASSASASSAGNTASSLDDFLAALPSSFAAASSTAGAATTAKGSGASQSRHVSDTNAGTATDTAQDTTTPQVAAFLSGVLGLPVAPLNLAAAPAPASAVKSAGAAATTGVDVGAASSLTGTATTATSSKAAYPTAPSHADPMPGSAGAPVSGAGPVTPDNQSGSAQTHDPSGDSGSSSHNNDATPSLASVVKSVTVETQLSPAPTLSPMQQVIDTVQKLTVGETEASNSVAAPVATTLPTVSSRTMTLVLEPENMGTVTVKMQLRGGNLDLQLDVSDAQTLGLLTKDKDSLTAAMTSQDYTIGTLTLRSSDTQNSSQGSDNGSQNQNQANSQGSSSSQSGNAQSGGGSQNGAGFSNGAGDDTRRNTPSRSNAQAAQLDASVPSSGTASGLYI